MVFLRLLLVGVRHAHDALVGPQIQCCCASASFVLCMRFVLRARRHPPHTNASAKQMCIAQLKMQLLDWGDVHATRQSTTYMFICTKKTKKRARNAHGNVTTAPEPQKFGHELQNDRLTGNCDNDKQPRIQNSAANNNRAKTSRALNQRTVPAYNQRTIIQQPVAKWTPVRVRKLYNGQMQTMNGLMN